MERRELPEGWEWNRLSDIIDYQKGKKPQFFVEIKNNDGLPYLSTDYLRCGNPSQFIPLSNQKECVVANHQNLLLIWDGSNSGEVFPGKKGVVSSTMIKISFKTESVDYKFIYYFLRTCFKILNEKTTGSSIPHVKKELFENIQVPIPPLKVQRRIVEILEHADALRRLRAQTDAETQILLQSVFYEMFGDPVRNEKGWKLQKLEDICIKIFGGGTPSTSNEDYFKGNIPWVSPKDMKDDFIFDSIDHISEKALNESSTQIAPDHSLLMVIRSGILKRKLPVAINVNPVTINQDMKAFIFKEDMVEPYYMLFFFKLYQNVLLKRVRSVTADNLEFNHIKTINVPLPPLNLQKQFSSFVNVIEIIKKQQAKSRNDIETLFNSLLDEVFIGKLSQQTNKSLSQ